MRRLILAVAFIAGWTLLNAQAYEGKVDYDKEKQACLVMEYDYPPEAVENAIISKMDKLGYKGKLEKGIFNKDKGFRVYKDARIAEISSNRLDYIINVDRKSRKEDDESILYFLITKDGDNALTRFNTEELGKAKAFLYNLLPEIEAANLELQISAQEETLSKSEKKLRSLKDSKEDMEKKIKKLEDDIKENEKDQEKQQQDIEDQRKLLDELKAKRKG